LDINSTTSSRNLSFTNNINITSSSQTLNIQFDLKYQGGTELFTIQSSTNINGYSNYQLEGFATGSNFFAFNAWWVRSRNGNTAQTMATTSVAVNDGSWHTILIVIDGTYVSIKVDNTTTVFTALYPLWGGTDYILNKMAIGMDFGYSIGSSTNSYRNILVYT
jgi:hypothetical protein